MMSENKLDSVIRLGYILRVWLRICLILFAKDVIVKEDCSRIKICQLKKCAKILT